MEPLTRAFAELQHAAAHLGDQFNQLGCQLQAMINHQDPAGCRTSHLPHRVSFASAFASLTNAAPKGSGLKLPFGGQAKSSKQQNGDAGKGKGNGQGRAPEERVLISEVCQWAALQWHPPAKLWDGWTNDFHAVDDLVPVWCQQHSNDAVMV